MIVLIFNQMNMGIRCEVGKLLLQIANNKVNIRNIRRAELRDLPLDQHLTANAQKPLWRTVRDWCKAAAIPRRHQHRIRHAIGRKARCCLCALHGIICIKRCDCRIKCIFGHIISHASVRCMLRMRMQ